ncbi:hypothetical protein E0F66_11370, partial [Streptococcus pyogenes]
MLDAIIANAPIGAGDQATYLIRALCGLDGIVSAAFDGDRAAYARAVVPRLVNIASETLRVVAIHIADGTAFLGTTAAEGINGTSGQDVFIGGGGGDALSGGAGSDIYVYAKQDGDLWIRDSG